MDKELKKIKLEDARGRLSLLDILRKNKLITKYRYQNRVAKIREEIRKLKEDV